jgi:NAD(P)-dependent dehydrogenase (short-subunit alcohol dehydrogenase family)
MRLSGLVACGAAVGATHRPEPASSAWRKERIVSNETVIVTGASSGIGLATAVAYAARGADVVLVARGARALEEAAVACRVAGAASATPVVADVLDDAAVHAAVSSAATRFGQIDVVVHAAMVMAYGTIEDLPLDVIDRVIDTATHGTVRVARAALGVFRAQRRGTLVVVTSVLGSVPVPGIGAYVTGKWAQIGLSRVLRLETGDAEDIVVTTVAPGAVDTPIYRRAANVIGHPGKPPPPVASPDRVAAAIVRAADKRRSRVSVGLMNQLVVFGFRVADPLYGRLVGPLYRRFALDRKVTIPATNGNVFTAGGADPRSSAVSATVVG